MTRIRTVDDSSTIRTIIAKQLTELGYEIEAAEDGFEGLAKLQKMDVFESSDVVSVDGNVVSCAGFDGKDERVEKYFSKLKAGCRESLEKLASACYDDSILDLGAVSARNSDKIVRFVIDTDKEARRLGLQLRVVGKTELKAVMSSITETAALPLFSSVSEARTA